jgi:transposase-like protein
MTKPIPQAKRLPTKLKSQILSEILSPNASIPEIAKKYDVSSTTLYGWRSNHIKKTIQNLKNTQELSKDQNNNFIELLPEEDLPQKANSSPDKIIPPIYKMDNPSKLSEISLTFNNNISLLLKGNINSSTLIKIINCLREESC